MTAFIAYGKKRINIDAIETYEEVTGPNGETGVKIIFRNSVERFHDINDTATESIPRDQTIYGVTVEQFDKCISWSIIHREEPVTPLEDFMHK